MSKYKQHFSIYNIEFFLLKTRKNTRDNFNTWRVNLFLYARKRQSRNQMKNLSKREIDVAWVNECYNRVRVEKTMLMNIIKMQFQHESISKCVPMASFPLSFILFAWHVFILQHFFSLQQVEKIQKGNNFWWCAAMVPFNYLSVKSFFPHSPFTEFFFISS